MMPKIIKGNYTIVFDPFNHSYFTTILSPCLCIKIKPVTDISSLSVQRKLMCEVYSAEFSEELESNFISDNEPLLSVEYNVPNFRDEVIATRLNNLLEKYFELKSK